MDDEKPHTASLAWKGFHDGGLQMVSGWTTSRFVGAPFAKEMPVSWLPNREGKDRGHGDSYLRSNLCSPTRRPHRVPVAIKGVFQVRSLSQTARQSDATRGVPAAGHRCRQVEGHRRLGWRPATSCFCRPQLRANADSSPVLDVGQLARCP
ncbi:hypothetical protein BCR34DRAFT_95969 [Clohesyomyces aquaticus]|uniref:Uncharacterized protein n=1 Tax=Clohesyomyces aquaticus TaxID=1231657 RepID=A0A1Y2A222_9PLEO|nr:hypothetical protein BCR34DRAFT_95969 [Clohesyomyces aquaticus]